MCGGATPRRDSRNCSTDTSQPIRPRASVRAPKNGLPRRPSRARVPMPRDVTEPNDQETGFGTGLRPRLERRRTKAKGEPEAASEAPLEEAPAETAADGQRSEVDELWIELEAAREREAGLRK